MCSYDPVEQRTLQQGGRKERAATIVFKHVEIIFRQRNYSATEAAAVEVGAAADINRLIKRIRTYECVDQG